MRAALSDDAETVVLPPVVSFVGGDAVSGLLAAGLIHHDMTALYIDIGTNAEIAVVTPREGFTVASTAAGPALEASGVTSGGPAAPGGIRTIAYVEGEGLVPEVIGGMEPGWLTGSGMVSAVDALMRAGHLDSDGLLSTEGPLEEMFDRLDDVLAIRVAGDQTHPVWLSQTDIRALQTAKAAIAAGVFTVVKATRVKPRKVKKVVVAGALGNALSEDVLLRLGIVPEGLSGAVEQPGNVALLGAAMMAADPELMTESLEAVRSAHHIELASDAEFKGRFIDALAFRPYDLKHGFQDGRG